MAKPEQVIHAHREIEERFGLSAAVRSGNILYISGLLSVSESFELIGAGDMDMQMRRIYERLENVLAAAHAGLENVVNEMSYTTDIKALGEAASIRAEFYRNADAAPPAATAVEVPRLFLEGAMLELVATAELL